MKLLFLLVISVCFLNFALADGMDTDSVRELPTALSVLSPEKVSIMKDLGINIVMLSQCQKLLHKDPGIQAFTISFMIDQIKNKGKVKALEVNFEISGATYEKKSCIYAIDEGLRILQIDEVLEGLSTTEYDSTRSCVESYSIFEGFSQGSDCGENISITESDLILASISPVSKESQMDE